MNCAYHIYTKHYNNYIYLYMDNIPPVHNYCMNLLYSSMHAHQEFIIENCFCHNLDHGNNNTLQDITMHVPITDLYNAWVQVTKPTP